LPLSYPTFEPFRRDQIAYLPRHFKKTPRLGEWNHGNETLAPDLKKVLSVSAERLFSCQRLYRARFFGHKFDLSGVLHVDFLPGETRLARAA